MLDEVGIRLAEIEKRYPRIFQLFGYDVALEVDAMHKPKIISSFRMMVNAVLMLLFMKPGQYPSIPELGIDIEQYLHEYDDDNAIIRKLDIELKDQCDMIDVSGLDISFSFDSIEGMPSKALLVKITGDERTTYGEQHSHVIIGISYDKLNRLYSRVEFY